MNINDIVIAGNVVSDPRTSVSSRGDVRASFRLAHNQRYLNKATGEWTDSETTFVDVVCWRQLAENVSDSVQRGNAVVVTGRLEVRQVASDSAGAPPRTFVTIEAATVGLDLAYGQATYRRVKRGAVVEQEARALADVEAAAGAVREAS